MIFVTNDNCIGGVQTMTRHLIDQRKGDKHIYIFEKNNLSLINKLLSFIFFIFKVFYASIFYKDKFIFAMWPASFLAFIPIIFKKKSIICIHSFIELKKKNIKVFLQFISKYIPIIPTSKSLSLFLKEINIKSYRSISVVAFSEMISHNYVKHYKKNQLSVAWVGRDSPEKNPNFIFKIIPKLLNNYKQIDIFFYGLSEGQLNITKFRGVNYNFLGSKSFIKDEIEIDLLVNTSLSENAPISILEALSKGMVILAPKIGEIVNWAKKINLIYLYDIHDLSPLNFKMPTKIDIPINFLNSFNSRNIRNKLKLI